MAEAIPYGAVSNILSKLVWLAGQELGLIFGPKKELGKLRKTLTTINAVLLDAEEKLEGSHAVKNWIRQLEDVVYDAEDLLDEFDYEILHQKVLARRQVRKFFSSTNPLVIGIKMGHRIKEIRERLDTVAADISKFNLSPRVAADMKAKNTDRETASKVRSIIIGREKDKELIIEALLQEQIDHHGDSVSIVAIVGFGGFGKTTLAQLVYNDTIIKNFFNPRIWVCVSEEFDVRIIFKKILESLGGTKVDDLDLDIYLRKLEESLEGKRYLLVLDDVWNENNSKWDDFSKHLVFGAPGSKILVTTRSKNVASTMGVNVTHILEGLNEDQSWALFKLVAFEGQGQINQNLSVIGKDVVQKCKGVPLTIKCLGGLMRQKPNEKYWLSIKENEIWKLLKEDDGVFPVLRLSYIYLPSHLKQCFAFCSIFPKDFKISKNLLIQSWRAQGYIQLRENENIQDIGDEYFNDLLSRFFFQEEQNDVYGNIIYCKMHDLMHNLALSVAKSNFYWMKDVKKKIPSGVCHVSLEGIPKEEISKKVVLTLSKAKGIRTMYFEHYYLKDLFIQNATFSSFNCLRMLNLRHMNIVILPNSIGELKHLRYLDLSDNWMEVLPDAITKLHHLQTLLLCHCSNLKELPKDIQQLISLEYLNIGLCDNLKCLPKGLGQLTSLQRLSRFIVNSVEKNFSTAATLNELSDLNDLGNYFCIENLNKVRNVELESMEAILKEKKRLQSLRLKWNCYARGDSEKDEMLLDYLKPHRNLKGLVVYNYGGARFSTWLSSLSNLVELHIDRCQNCQHLPPLDHLSSLKSLFLHGFHVLKHLPPLDHLSSLESLSLQGFHVLEHLPPLDHLSYLKSLSFQGFHVLEHLPPLDHLSSLNSLSLNGFRVLEHLPPLDHLSSLKSLTLQGLHVLEHLPPLDHLSSLKSLSLNGFRVLEHLPPLDHISSLNSLSLHGFHVLEHLPPLDHFSSLNSLSLHGFHVLEHLPPLDHLSSLKSFSLNGFRVLKHLPPLDHLSSLKSLNLQGLHVLEHLPPLDHLSSLKSLSLHGFRILEHLPPLNLLSSLKSLSLHGFHVLEYLPPLDHLSSLRSLDLQGLHVLDHLPPLDHLSSLKSLSLHGFRILQYLPPLDHLSSLESLILQGLQVLEHVEDSFPLPYSTPRTFFPSLKKLSIRECPNLKGWWRIENENKGSIAKLPWFSCLAELKISNCQNLTSMPLFPTLAQDLTLNGTSIRLLQQTLKMKMIKASMTSSASSSLGSTSHSYSSITLPLSNLRCLTLISIKDLEVLSEEFRQNLTSLALLKLEDCPKLESLFLQKMNCLPSLHELLVTNCPLTVFPDWILNLTSLRTLEIKLCPELQHLPEKMHRLTSLQQLSIIECPQLSERYKKETGINWPDIAHIPSVVIQD